MIHELDYSNKELIKRINKFLEVNDSDYMQSIEWNKIRNEETKYFLYYIDKNDSIIWTCNLLEKTKNNEKLLYAPRGPVFNSSNKGIFNDFLKNIKLWMEKKQYNKLVLNPYITSEIIENIPTQYKYSITKNNDYANLYDSCKLAIMDIIFNEEELINKLPSKFRQNTRRSYRKNLISRISKNIDFENFYKLYIDTATRHEFKPHDIEYFKRIYEVFKDKLIFLEVWYNDLPLAMSIDIIHNNKLIYLYGVSSSENRNLLGMYNMQWEAIKYCINNKIHKYDFGGVFCEENDVENKDFGLYNFKKGYCYNGFIDIIPDITFDFRKEEKND